MKKNRLTVFASFGCGVMKSYKVLLFLLVCSVGGAVIAEDSPMQGLEYSGGVRLNGKTFWSPSDVFLEKDGYAVVQGRKLHYWLYDSYRYAGGDTSSIHNSIIPRWVTGMGYAIDFDNIEKFNPNSELASSVKALMQQRGCDVSVTLVTDNPSYHYVIINEYSKAKNIYFSVLYPLVR
ncbi:MAG: hypothetical protein Ta2A_04280 [Treponemataceae bacterium]|nr:MAG: hypothetical protein Ta2A_04280 [Treponemataceae bacterium]